MPTTAPIPQDSLPRSVLESPVQSLNTTECLSPRINAKDPQLMMDMSPTLEIQWLKDALEAPQGKDSEHIDQPYHQLHRLDEQVYRLLRTQEMDQIEQALTYKQGCFLQSDLLL